MSRGICFRKSVRCGGGVIAGKIFGDGEKGQLLLPQGKFQAVLMRRLETLEGVEVRIGWAVSGFEDQKSSVSLQIAGPEGREEVLQAAYLIAADGAHSTIRKALGMAFLGETLDAQLVATDIRFVSPSPAHSSPSSHSSDSPSPSSSNAFGVYDPFAPYDANFVLDPRDYGLIGRIDNSGLWRVSYGVPAGLTEEEVRRGVGEKVRRMLGTVASGGGENEEGEMKWEVVRVAPYQAQQRCVENMRRGRVCLVGDAAHCRSFLSFLSFPGFPFLALPYSRIVHTTCN